jgi:EmrB/QacA subfamily drug resistance transporter
VTEPSSALRREFRLVLAGLMLALTLAALDQNIVSTALPRIVSELGGLAHLSWVVTAFMLTSTTTTLLYGKLSDLYGRKPLFVVAILLFLLGSVLCGVANSMTALILSRGLQGLGAGGLITLAQTTIGDLLPPRERGRYQGLFTGVFALCSVAGPLIGGVITDFLSWRWIFYVNLPVGAAALALILAGLRQPSRTTQRNIDYLGAILLAATTTTLLLMLSWGGVVALWASPLIIALGLATAVSGLLLLAHERSAIEPILPLRLFRNGVFAIGVAVTGLNAIALFGAVVFMPLYFQLVIGATPTAAGLMIAPMMAGVIAASVLGGHLVSRTGRYKIYPVFGLGASILSFLGMAWLATTGGHLALIEACLIGLGFGLGLVMPNLTVAIQNAVGRSNLGIATSTAAFVRSLGGAVGVALSGEIMTARLHALLPAAFGQAGGGSVLNQGMTGISALSQAERALIADAYRQAVTTTFFAGAIIAGLAFLIVIFLPELPLESRGLRPLPEPEGGARKPD